VFLNVCEHFPEGIEEPILRDILREEFGIREPKGIKIHLADLEEEGLLSKISQKGKSNIWKIPTEPIFVKALGHEATPEFVTYAERFMFSEDREKFHKTQWPCHHLIRLSTHEKHSLTGKKFLVSRDNISIRYEDEAGKKRKETLNVEDCLLCNA